MKLEEYVRQTLVDITNGVAEAQKESKLWIAPGTVEGEPRVSPQMVKFEVEVVVSKEAGGGVKVWSLGEAKMAGNTQHSNRLTFEIPVYFQARTPRHPDFEKTHPELSNLSRAGAAPPDAQSEAVEVVEVVE